MIINISVARLNRCNSPTSNTIPYGHIKISALDALVGIGDFVMFDLDGTSTLGRIVDACMLDNIPVAELAQSIIDDDEQDEKKVFTLLHIWRPVETTKRGYERLTLEEDHSLRGIPEVFESWTATWADTDHILTIAFVFSAVQLCSQNQCALNGIKNLFFARYSNITARMYTHLSTNFHSFSSNHAYSQRVYSTILYIRGEFDRVFFRPSQHQGDRGYFNIFMTADCWNYFAVLFKRNSEHTRVNHVRTRSCRKRSSVDLTQTKIRVRTVLDVVTIETIRGLQYLCNIFGSAIGLGVRKKFPTLRDPSSNCGFGDKINVLDIRPNKRDKVVFRYDFGQSKLNVAVCYSHHTVTESLVTSGLDHLPQLQVVALPVPEEANVESTTEQQQDNIIGAQLFIGNVVYEVTEIVEDQARCVSVNSPEVLTVNLAVNMANNLVDEYNLQ